MKRHCKHPLQLEKLSFGLHSLSLTSDQSYQKAYEEIAKAAFPPTFPSSPSFLAVDKEDHFKKPPKQPNPRSHSKKNFSYRSKVDKVKEHF